MNFNTEIEKKANKACELSAFNALNLAKLKSNVAEILSFIGRSDMFSTYTKHDISHVDAMLNMCEWLIPPSTQKEMTAVDWLLITLSIYLHDLGMVTTYEEFENRNSNNLYTSFRNEIEVNPKLAEYKHRAPKNNEDLREKFFFQEFIRKQHGNRIKDWISGKINNYPSNSISKLIDIIADELNGLPIRFINHLSSVCGSHQSNDIDNIDQYPIFQSYGSDRGESANVQYAALILRTADLLHVTKDRTPSVMYQIINISDPLGIEEWDKQLGTFSVRHEGRKFDEKDILTHKIKISADFKEERPFFSMSEYITWANSEITNCKRWADKSKENKDAADYFYPWIEIVSDIRVENNEPHTLKFELDRGKLLDLLVGHTIYNDPTVVVRELLQNAIDAVRFFKYKENPNYLGQVNVYWKNKERELIVIDNGIGMNQEVIKNNLMKVGASYYNSADFASENPDFSPISRFGIGILTCFMVSDDIEIITYQKEKGHRIKMTSVESNYLLKELSTGDNKLSDIESHGTKIIVKFRESVDLKDKTIEDILKYWVINPSCPVFYHEDSKEKKLIGFMDAKSILRQYTPEITNDENEDEDEDEDDMNKLISYEIETKKIIVKSSKAELSFLVGKRYTPERRFVDRFNENDNNLPIVCVEGIRVDNKLPGFDDNIIGVLLIEGTKDFKTTVSRNGLEKDDSYDDLVKKLTLCFVEYIDDEIKRVANSQGNPLSQASTVGLWIYKSLIENIDSKFEQNIVRPSFDKIPQLVFETIENNKTTRKLINKEELLSVDTFWTIESRLADSLGIISRDLGKELSTNEFKILLAIDEKNDLLSPIIYDAHLFKAWIISSHKVAGVEYSMSKQQTQIIWTKKTSEEIDFYNKQLNLLKNSTIIDKQILKYKYPKIDGGFHRVTKRRRYYKRRKDFSTIDFDEFPYRYLTISTSPIVGDVENIELVITRLTDILKNETIVFQQWQTLNNCLNIALNNNEIEIAITCVLALNLLCGYVFGTSYYIEALPFEQSWREIIADLDKYFAKKVDTQSLKRLHTKYFDNKKTKFDASLFWFDWYTR